MKNILLTIAFCAVFYCSYAQSSAGNYRGHLDKVISLSVRQQPVSAVLDQISRSGSFWFSYSGRLFPQDSLISIKADHMPVREVLDQIFQGKVDYREFREYIVLRYAANHFTIEPENISTAEGLYLISGYVVDTRTGLCVKQASVYEKRLLQSALTDETGYFKLRFKGDHQEVILTASKENYRDTSLIFLSDIKIKPEGYEDPDDDDPVGRFLNGVENSGISRFFISSKQRMQSLNIPDFFANTPFQASLTPGLSSHGMMSAQVVNKFSLNVFGGYTAGVDGLEIGGLFNINKGDVRSVQVAGLFNTVGGSVEGVQVAGLMNDVRQGFQGVQVGGLLNHVRKSVNGVQVAGLMNVVSDSLGGTQVGGLLNVVSGEAEGIQISGLINYARKVTGMQIGLINFSSENEGYSIGLLNLVQKGYHQIALSSNETIHTSAALKLGNDKLYNIILAGRNFGDTARLETLGYGLGHDFLFSNTFSLRTELTSQYIYQGNWDYASFLSRVQTSLQFRLARGLAVFAGPAYSVYHSDAPAGNAAKGYKDQVYPDQYQKLGTSLKGWVGWNLGITIF